MRFINISNLSMIQKYKYDVSIVIVCMNNLKMLYPCLESIKKYTSCSYEVLVTAYLFTPDNLKMVQEDFPWVTFIESNEIRGFSENNNLALRQAQGKYCFVLNDDTEMKMDVVGELVKTIESLPEEVAIVSPTLLNADGSIQVCGRPYISAIDIVMGTFGMGGRSIEKVRKSKVFRTYNIIGACFLIKTEVFRSIGWFDEYYFFCPEDIAVSTTLNKQGYSCYVDPNAEIIHYEGNSGTKNLSKVKMATLPAGDKGSVRFFSNGSMVIEKVLGLLFFIAALLKYIKFSIKSTSAGDAYDIFASANLNTAKTVLTNKTPKEIFKDIYCNQVISSKKV